MTNDSLARAYLRKSSDRLDVLDLLVQKQAWSDVVREAQEIVELALKGILREVGIEPPKWHDVGGMLRDESRRLPEEVRPHVEGLAEVSAWLRRERELAFYGDVDAIPTEAYSEGDASRARDGARLAVACARRVIAP